MYQVISVKGEDIINFRFINSYYEGKSGDIIFIEKIIRTIEIIWNNMISLKFPRPSDTDIIIIYSKVRKPKFIVEYDNHTKENYNEPTAAITIPSTRKIFLTNPLPSSKKSNQVLAHELGHWYFDRLFDNTINVPRDGYFYKFYSEAAAFILRKWKQVFQFVVMI